MPDKQPDEGTEQPSEPTEGKPAKQPKRKGTGNGTGKRPSAHARSAQKRAEIWMPIFLEALSKSGNVSKASTVAGVGRRQAYQRREVDAAFADSWDDAMDEALDALEDEAKRRAFEGTDRPVFYKGEIVGHIREYSDTLLIFLLKGGRPEKFRDNFDLSKLIAEIQASRAPQVDRPSNPPALDPPTE